MNFLLKTNKTREEILQKLPRPQAIIPFREIPNCNTGEQIPSNLNISPLLFTPKIRMKIQTKASPTNSTSKKMGYINNLPMLNKNNNESFAHGHHSDEIKIVRKNLRNLSARKEKFAGETPVNRKESSFHDCSVQETSETSHKNKTFHEEPRKINNFTLCTTNTTKISDIKNLKNSKISNISKIPENSTNSFKKPTEKRVLKPMVDLKTNNPEKKMAFLKEYLNSISTSIPQQKILLSNNSKFKKPLEFPKKTLKPTVKPQSPSSKPPKSKRFLTPNQKTATYLEESNAIKPKINPISRFIEPESSYQADESQKNMSFTKKDSLKNTSFQNSQKNTSFTNNSAKKMSLNEGIIANNGSSWNKKKLSMAEISSILNSEEMLKMKFKENLHNFWKLSNETSTNDEMRKTSDFSINLVKTEDFVKNGDLSEFKRFIAKNQDLTEIKKIMEGPLNIIKNHRKESIPNLLADDQDDNDNEVRGVGQVPLEFDVEVDRFIEKLSISQKTKTNLEITDIVQKLASSKKNSGEDPITLSSIKDSSNILYEEIFDFSKSIDLREKTSKKPSKNENSMKPTIEIEDIIEIPEIFDKNNEKPLSPNVSSTTKNIKALYNGYNNTKFASPLMNSSKKRAFDEFFDEDLTKHQQSIEGINPIDEFCDDS